MKISTNYLLDKIKDVRPDAVSIALFMLLAFLLGATPLVLFMALGKVAINKDSVDLATIIGGITGSTLTFLTLAFLLLNNLADSQEKLFHQALAFTERLLTIYTKAVNEYEATGKKKQFFDENMQVAERYIVPCLRTTEPLFVVVMQHLKLANFSKLQRAGLLGIVRGQLRPLVVVMRDEMKRLDRAMNLDYNQIAERQLTELDALLATSQQ